MASALPLVDTEVLIVGSGPSGSALALALSTYGTPNIVVTKYRWLADTPRAHITNSRCMEVLRDLGVEKQVKLHAAPQDILGNTVFATSLAGEELGRIMAWGTHPRRLADYTMASPCTPCDMPQNLMEPILFGEACTRKTQPMFMTEYLSHTQHGPTADYPHPHVISRVRNRLVSKDADPESDVGVTLIRSRFLIGADGGKSKIAQDVNLPFEGKMGVAGAVNVVFKGDLSKWVQHRPSVLYWILQPGSGAQDGGIGMGLMRMVRPWDEWLALWGCPPEGKDFTEDEAKDIVRRMVGVSDLDITIKSVSCWTINDCYATRYASEPFSTEHPYPLVYCAGDAVHRHPPSNGLGSNTSIQDSYNLAWKLHLVLSGTASPSLLNSYDLERSPVGKQIVKRANKSIGEFGPIFQALGFGEGFGPEEYDKALQDWKTDSATGEAIRKKVKEGIELKNYEFNALGVEMNHSYASSAVVADSTPSKPSTLDPELHYIPTTKPGHRVPHAWLLRTSNGEKVSTLDLCGTGGKTVVFPQPAAFTLFTGLVGAAAWKAAMESAEKELGVRGRVVVVGPAAEFADMLGEWADLRETEESGAVLVRPDQVVAWRMTRFDGGKEEAVRELGGAFMKILGK